MLKKRFNFIVYEHNIYIIFEDHNQEATIDSIFPNYCNVLDFVLRLNYIANLGYTLDTNYYVDIKTLEQ